MAGNFLLISIRASYIFCKNEAIIHIPVSAMDINMAVDAPTLKLPVLFPINTPMIMAAISIVRPMKIYNSGANLSAVSFLFIFFTFLCLSPNEFSDLIE